MVSHVLIGVSMNNITKAAIGVVGAAALASGIYFSTREPTRDIGTLGLERSTLTKVAKTKSGKQVRIIGMELPGAKEEDTEFGKSLVLLGVPSNAECNIVFSAEIVKKDGRDWPDIKGLDKLLNGGALPVLVGVDDDDIGVWNCLFKGESCLAMAEMENYIGSDVQQFINHPKRKYLLKTKAKSGSKDKHGNPKDIVVLDDIDADPAAEIWFGHEWFGRHDANFSVYQGGTVVSQVEKARLEAEKKNEK